MKNRNGFVSNSSSSSFIVSARSGVSPRISLTLHEDVRTYTQYVIGDDETLERYFEDRYGRAWRKDQEYVEKFDEYIEEISKGNELYICSAYSDGDDAIGNIIYNCGISDDSIIGGKVLWSEW